MKFLATLFAGILIGMCVSSVMPCMYAKVVINGISPTSSAPAHNTR
jgi:hypothetical protein